MFSGYYAIVKDQHGHELERYELDETDLLDLDTYAARYARDDDVEWGRDGDAGGDFSVTLTDEPNGVRHFASKFYWFSEE